jgi:hypothetical protein
MITQPYDIFRKDGSGEPVWVEAVENMERAKMRVIELSAHKPGQYMIFCQHNRQIISTMRTVSSPAARAEHRNHESSLEDFAVSSGSEGETLF